MKRWMLLLIICCGCFFFFFILFMLMAALLAVNAEPDYVINIIQVERSIMGQGAFWDQDSSRLFWVDSGEDAVNCYDPVTKEHTKAIVNTDGQEGPTTLVIPVKGEDDKFIVSLKGDLAVIIWNCSGKHQIVLPYFIEDLKDHKELACLTEGKVDARDYLWVGSVGAQLSWNPNTYEILKGGLSKVRSNGTVLLSINGIHFTSGFEWSLDTQSMYVIDAVTHVMYEYDVDLFFGTVENRRTVFHFDDEALGLYYMKNPNKPRSRVRGKNPRPSGLTIDSDGFLWVCIYEGEKIIRIDTKTMEVVKIIELERVLQPVSLIFGGKDLNVLYVTSAHSAWTDKHEEYYYKSGYLVAIENLGVTGVPCRRFPLKSDFWEIPTIVPPGGYDDILVYES